MYTDGTFKNIFGYPDNALDWLSFLCAENKGSPLFEVFFNNSYTTSDLMLALNEIFRIIKENGGDGLSISNSRGEPDNLISIKGTALYDVNNEQVNIAKGFLQYLSLNTGWTFDVSKWDFGCFRVSRYTKGQISNPEKGSHGPSLAVQFDELIASNPISWAITKASQVQFTIEKDEFV